MPDPTEPVIERAEEILPTPSTEPVPSDKGQEPVETSKAEEDTKPETETKEEPEVEEETPKPRSGYARKKAENQRLYARNQELETELQRLKDGGPPEQKEPKPEDFNGDYLAFEKASVAFAAERAIEKALAKAREQDFQAREAEAHQDSIADFVEEAKAYSKKIPDFDQAIDAMYGSLGPLPPVLRDLIADVDNGHMVLYQLAKNPGLARDIYAEGPIGAAMKIGELNAKLSLPQAQKLTKAPPPIASPKGGAAPPRDLYGLASKSEDISDYVRARSAKKD